MKEMIILITYYCCCCYYHYHHHHRHHNHLTITLDKTSVVYGCHDKGSLN